jgi:hypothetical protein
MKVFEGSHDAFQMLGRLVGKGKLRNFNDAIADELVLAGYAFVDGDELLPTQMGAETARTVTWPSRQPMARRIVPVLAHEQHVGG